MKRGAPPFAVCAKGGKARVEVCIIVRKSSARADQQFSSLPFRDLQGHPSFTFEPDAFRSISVIAWLQQFELATQFTTVHPPARKRVDSLFPIKHADFRPGLTH